MLMLLVRLGLARGEVRSLNLDDIDWCAAELVVRGKGNRIERLPLPADVGQAVAAYLQRGRPVTAQGRTVFVRMRAPHRPLSSSGVTQAVVSGCFTGWPESAERPSAASHPGDSNGALRRFASRGSLKCCAIVG